ncbi:MAG: hypothetical protein ACKO2P_18410 [Planctomycetota bacterium]
MRRQSGVVLFAVLLSGCSGGLKEFPVAEVSGVVLCEGTPVPFAKVQFNPKAAQGSKSAIVGKPGFAFADKDGKFVLSTYGDGDGAVIGKHVVTAVPDSGYPCNCHSDDITPLMEVDVKEGQKNEFEVQVPLKKGAAQPTPDPFSDPE